MLIQETGVCFLKNKEIGVPEYAYDFIPQNNNLYNTRSSEDVATFYCRTDIFQYSFFPSTSVERNKCVKNIRQSKSILSFQISLLKVCRPTLKPIYNIHNPICLKLLTRLGLSHLHEHKSNHNFQDSVCSYSLELESPSLFSANIRKTVYNDMQFFDENTFNRSDNEENYFFMALVNLNSVITNLF